MKNSSNNGNTDAQIEADKLEAERKAKRLASFEGETTGMGADGMIRQGDKP